MSDRRGGRAWGFAGNVLSNIIANVVILLVAAAWGAITWTSATSALQLIMCLVGLVALAFGGVAIALTFSAELGSDRRAAGMALLQAAIGVLGLSGAGVFGSGIHTAYVNGGLFGGAFMATFTVGLGVVGLGSIWIALWSRTETLPQGREAILRWLVSRGRSGRSEPGSRSPS